MSDDSSNPYVSPSSEAFREHDDAGDMPPETRESIDYFGSITEFFDHPEWVNGLLMASLTVMIPILGPFVVLGYEYDCVAQRLAGRGQRPYSLFTFDRFGEYLMRALWVMLYGLCASLLIIPVMLVCFLVFSVLASSKNEVLAVIGIVIAGAIYLGTILFMNIAMLPGMFRVAMTNDIGQGFDFAFIRDFISKMWFEQILVLLFVMFSSGIMINLGYLLCCIGALPAVVISWFSMSHLLMQMYQVYLSRGGMKIQVAP